MSITNGTPLLVVFIRAHRGDFARGGFVLLAALGVILENRIGRREVAVALDDKSQSIRNELQSVKQEIQSFGEEHGRFKEKSSVGFD